MEILQGTIIGDGSNTNTVPPVNPVPNTDANKSKSAVNTGNEQNESSHGEDFAKIFNETLNKFSEENPNDSEEVKKSKGFFKSFMNYIKSDKFEKDVNSNAEKYNLPPKQVAKNFFCKVLSTISDILGVVVNTVGNILHIVVDVLAVVANGAIDILVKAGNALARLISGNHTNAVA